MSSIYIACIAISLVVIVALALPFFSKGPDQLQSAMAIDDVEQLKRAKQELAQRYLEDEKAFADGLINKLVWQQRQNYLFGRYVDVARRLDFIQATKSPPTGSAS